MHTLTPRQAPLAGALALLLIAGCAPTAAQPPPATGTAAVRIGDRTITLDEVDRVALTEDAGQFRGMRLRDALFEARKAAVDSLIAEHLLSGEARRTGQTSEALVARETTPVTRADVEAWYAANQARVEGAPLEKIAPRIHEGLEEQRRSEARGRIVERLKKGVQVTILLEPPRDAVRVESSEPSRGPVNAPVQIVMYSDYQCPYCARVEPTLARLRQQYGERVRLVYRHFPLSSIHPRAVDAAKAAQCAHEQGRFWEYHDRLFAAPTSMETADLLKHAAALSLDANTFTACTTSESAAKVVRDNTASGEVLGVTATPAFFINGRFLSGAQPYDAFARVIDEELKDGKD